MPRQTQYNQNREVHHEIIRDHCISFNCQKALYSLGTLVNHKNVRDNLINYLKI
jgi:hypothetical protein